MQLDLATAEYIGAREQQQDLAAALPLASGALLILADGLGGHESGAEAARIVVTTFKEAGAGGRFEHSGSRRQALREVLDLANARIAAGVDPAHGHRGMASTVVAAVVSNGEMNWVSVGDSHLYIWREGRLHKLNEDHSQAGLMVKSGQYRRDDPEVLAVKSVLVSALTGRKLEIVDLPPSGFRLVAGDVLMLASDGLNTLSDGEIERIVDNVREHGAIKLSTTLLESVRNRRLERQDNTTVVVARVLEPVRAAATTAPVRRPDADGANEIDDTSEKRTERFVPESEAESVVTSETAAKPVAESSSASIPDDAPAAAGDAQFNTAQLAAVADAPSKPMSDPKEAERPPHLKPRSGRPGRLQLNDVKDGLDDAPIPLGAAPADLPPEAVLSPGSSRAATSPARHVPKPGFVRNLVILALVLLASGVALAALKSDWLSGIVPGFGHNGRTPPTALKTGASPRVNADAVSQQAKSPAAATAPAADRRPTVSPDTSPDVVSPTAPASSATGPSADAQANGEAAAPADTPQVVLSPAPAEPPLIEPERPATRPSERNRTP